MILTFAVSGYRSLRELVLPMGRLNIVTGPNGSGKSSFYKALRLLADTAQGRIISSLAVEGGLQSTLWAGPEAVSRRMKTGEIPIQGTTRRDPVSLRLGFASEDYGYGIDLGLPVPNFRSRFNRDPEIKAEAVWAGEVLRRSNMFASRSGPSVQVLDEKGARTVILTDLPPFDSMMTHAADPRGVPELLMLRERMRGWRFYDHFRTDPDAPARRAQIGTRTPVLASNGADIADSFAWNPHKMMGVPLACSATLFRRRGLLQKHLNETADYLFQTHDDELNPGTRSLQCGRRNDALKLWAAWQLHGDEGFDRRLCHLFDLAAEAARLVDADPRLELLVRPESLNVCFAVPGVSSEAICDHLDRTGRLLIGHGAVGGRSAIRLVVVNPALRPGDLADILAEIKLAAAEVGGDDGR